MAVHFFPQKVDDRFLVVVTFKRTLNVQTSKQRGKPFIIKKMLSYRRETALQGALDLARSGILELADNILRILYVYLQPLRHILPAKLSNSVNKNAKYGLLRRSRSFRVIEVGTNRKPVCDFLLAININ